MRTVLKSKKIASLNLRVSTETKALLLQIGARENRTMVNTVEWLAAEYGRKHKLHRRVPDEGQE